MNNTLTIVDCNGSAVSSVDLDASWLEAEKGTQAVHDTIVAFLAAQRAGTASTKTRSEVSGGGAKPFRQKGTGRGRAGSIRQPNWRGGGVSFGPKPRSFAKKINRKVRLLALKRAFTERVLQDNVIVVDDIVLKEPKTRDMVNILDSLAAGDDVLIVVNEIDNFNLLLASRNLPGVEVMRAAAVNPYWLLLFKKILFVRDGLDAFGARLASL